MRNGVAGLKHHLNEVKAFYYFFLTYYFYQFLCICFAYNSLNRFLVYFLVFWAISQIHTSTNINAQNHRLHCLLSLAKWPFKWNILAYFLFNLLVCFFTTKDAEITSQNCITILTTRYFLRFRRFIQIFDRELETICYVTFKFPIIVFFARL